MSFFQKDDPGPLHGGQARLPLVDRDWPVVKVRRFATLMVLAALAAFFVAGSTSAAPGTLTFALTEHDGYNPVDYLTWCGDCTGVDYTTGTPWVINPGTSWPYSLDVGGCLWDLDDAYEFSGFDGTLDAGQSVSVQECAYWSSRAFQPRVSAILLDSPSAQLQITVTWTWDTGSRTMTVLSPTRSSFGMWRYFDCLASPTPLNASPPTPADGTMVTVPDSNNGQAVPYTITTTITNLGKKVGKTGGYIAGGFSAGGKPAYELGCRTYRAP